jgi:hypothetical protein
LAEYEGFLEVEESTIKEMCGLLTELIDAVQSMAQNP